MLRVERLDDVPAVAIVAVDGVVEGVLRDAVGILAGGGPPLPAVAGFGGAIPHTMQ